MPGPNLTYMERLDERHATMPVFGQFLSLEPWWFTYSTILALT
jgi:hypothetical protein